MKISRTILVFCVFYLTLAVSSSGGKMSNAANDFFSDPEKLVRGLYDSVTFEPGTTPDWDHVRNFFIPEVVFAVRQTKATMSVLDLNGFVAWWESDIERHKMKERGFSESVEKMKMTLCGNIAQVFVVYRARFITPETQTGQIGLDSFSLMKRDGRWWIVSVANDIITPENPLPEELRIQAGIGSLESSANPSPGS